MKPPSKRRPLGAALLSGLVFPGVGQWYMGRRRLALLFAVPALAAGFVYFDLAVDQASELANQLLSGALPLDPAAIAARSAAAPTPWAMTVSGWVFVLCWVGSIVEALLNKPRA